VQKPELLAALEVVRERFASKGQHMPFSAEIAVDRAFARRIPPVPFSVLLDHFEYLLKLVGPEHVGIGSDFDGIALSVEGMETAADLPKITAGLLERGWRAEELRGLLGENLLRVMAAVQAAGG
jgi:membrane dipeptidase